MAKVATDFERIIQEGSLVPLVELVAKWGLFCSTAGRERKKNEALAQKIFSKDRRQSAPTKLKPGAGPSLASRVGVKKLPPPHQQRTASLGPKALPAGNIDGDWTHDLHGTVNGSGGGGGRGRNNGGNAGAGGLASRISAPGGRPAPAAAANSRRGDRRGDQRAAKVAAAIERSGGMADVQMTSAPISAPTGPAVKKGLSIRGLAGPFAVMAQNFAPGTTAADIESAMTPVGGEMLSCRIIKTSPLIVAEMVFATKEGGDAVIDTFNNQTADGRIIKVYPKPGGYKESVAANGSRPANVRSTSSHVVDGTNGFPEQMEEDDGGLYSDRMVGGGNSGNRRGRGFNRGGRR
ncbi:putative RNA-binding proteinc [Colletotrichum spaethianum]|uniref:RNA-binding proteinc n=1 Tax=Colletotrichum spaethianum TaxID=700344 RepID=A0AA37L8E1_9PEZI|nr:putative RNA-binding proteinc [Colletotrichum spaethianum]GKT43712.1 putative RNA-binding proteinc [Colletotrichum spaethianum]